MLDKKDQLKKGREKESHNIREQMKPGYFASKNFAFQYELFKLSP